jgi:hypothetical protein
VQYFCVLYNFDFFFIKKKEMCLRRECFSNKLFLWNGTKQKQQQQQQQRYKNDDIE